jgi:hypothetical protein
MAQAYLTTADVAHELGVRPATVSSWRTRSQPGQPYAEHPFPAPDVKIGNASGWLPERLPEMRAWMAARPGMGVGGGPKPKSPETPPRKLAETPQGE